MSQQNGPQPSFDPIASNLWMASHLDTLRRDYESRMKQMLLVMADLIDAVDRLMADPSCAQLPPGWQDGLRGFRKKLAQALADAGVTPVAALGELVDPRVHHVEEVVDRSGPPGLIVGEILPGYLWQGKTLRPASVVSVAFSPEAPGAETPGDLQPRHDSGEPTDDLDRN